MMSSSQPRRRAGDDYSTPHPPSRIPQGLSATPPLIPGASAHHTIAPFEPRGPSPGPSRTRLGAMTTSPRGAPHAPPHRYEAQAGSAYPSAHVPTEDPRSRALGRAYERPAPLEPADREDPRRLPYRYPEYERDYPPQEAMYLAPPKSHASAALAAPGSSSAAVAGPPYEPAPHPYSASQGPALSSRRLSAGDTSSLFAHHPPPLSRSPLPPTAMRERPEREDILPRGSPSRSLSTQPRTCFTPSPRHSVEGLSRGQAELYNQGWHDAMEAVQQGVVWIEGVAHSRVPMWIPESERQSYPPGPPPRRDERERMEREYLEAEWRERAGGAREQPWRWEQREAYGPHPSRSQSAPDPRTTSPYQDYPAVMGGALTPYGPSAPPMPPQPAAHYPVPYGTPVSRGPMRRPIPSYTMPPEHYGHMPPGYPLYGPHAGLRTHLQPPQIRTRQQISCHPCRNRKVKCSGTKPCDACVKIKRESECQYEKTVRRRGKGKKGIQDPSERGDSREGDSRDDIKRDYAKSGTSDQDSDDDMSADHPQRSSSLRSRSHFRSRSRSRSASPPRKSDSQSSSRADRERHRVRETDQESHQRHSNRRPSDAATARDCSP